MIHLVFFTCIFSLCTASASYAFALLFYFKYRKRLIIDFSFLILLLILLVVSRMFEMYGILTGTVSKTAVELFSLSLEKIAFILGAFFGPSFCFSLIGLVPRNFEKILLRIAAAVYTVIACMELMLHGSSVSGFLQNGIGLAILFGIYLILCLQAGFRLETLADQKLNKILKLLFVISLLALPPSLYKYINNRPFLPYHFENSLALLCVTIFSIVFAFRFLNVPTFYSQNNLTDYFKEKYKTTSRENEIVLQALLGKTNTEIADTLCISIRTVESHLYNIFQKTGVKNRVQLINLIASNRS